MLRDTAEITLPLGTQFFLAHGINATKVSIDSARRWRDKDELLYSIRGVHEYGPSVVRNIHTLERGNQGDGLVTGRGQVPIWLDRSAETRQKVEIVHHSQIFQDKDNLPTFNSIAIESQLHHISDMSDVVERRNESKGGKRERCP